MVSLPAMISSAVALLNAGRPPHAFTVGDAAAAPAAALSAGRAISVLTAFADTPAGPAGAGPPQAWTAASTVRRPAEDTQGGRTWS